MRRDVFHGCQCARWVCERCTPSPFALAASETWQVLSSHRLPDVEVDCGPGEGLLQRKRHLSRVANVPVSRRPVHKSDAEALRVQTAGLHGSRGPLGRRGWRGRRGRRGRGRSGWGPDGPERLAVDGAARGAGKGLLPAVGVLRRDAVPVHLRVEGSTHAHARASPIQRGGVGEWGSGGERRDYHRVALPPRAHTITETTPCVKRSPSKGRHGRQSPLITVPGV